MGLRSDGTGFLDLWKRKMQNGKRKIKMLAWGMGGLGVVSRRSGRVKVERGGRLTRVNESGEARMGSKMIAHFSAFIAKSNGIS